MSRSGYVEFDCFDQDEILAHGRYRGRVASTIRGAKGQAFLRELIANLDAMPVKELHAGLFNKDGCMCALGVVAAARGVSIREPEDYDDYVGDEAAAALGIHKVLANEIMYLNDDSGITPHQRWLDVRQWAASKIVAERAQGAR